MGQYVQHLTIKHLSEADRPREKLLSQGRSSLSIAELIGILLGSGNKDQNAVELAQTILASVDHNVNKLAKLSIGDLQKFNGIGEAKAINIISALELGRRREDEDTPLPQQIRSSKDIYDLMKPHMLDLNQEEFWIISLTRANRIIRKERISAGGTTQTVADPKIIFKKAMDHQAVNLIAVHNHPSGTKQPSNSDKLLTEKLKKGGELLDITLLDHLIFTNNGYYSFTDEHAL